MCFFSAMVVCMSLFGTSMFAGEFFFQNHPPLPQKAIGQPLPGGEEETTTDYYLHVTGFIASTTAPSLSSRIKGEVTKFGSKTSSSAWDWMRQDERLR